MNITLVLGTARVGRESEKITTALKNIFAAKGSEVTFVDVKDHVTSIATVPPWGEGGADSNPTKWKEIVEGTDSFVFVLPEYNHSYPGEWKLLMDSLYKEYTNKKAFVVAVGGGMFAGARVMEHLMPVLVNFQFQVSATRLHVASASKQFDEDGNFTDEKTKERFETFVDDVIKGA